MPADFVHGPAQNLAPRDPRLKEAWRAAAAAYRLECGKPHDLKHGNADACYKAAIAAFRAVMPDLSEREAMLETVQAISYASREHPKWLYALYRPRPRDR